MRQRELLAFFLLLGLMFLAACGGGGSTTAPSTTPTGQASTAAVSLAIRDTPPAGVTVLSFEVTVTGAVLQPGNVSLVSTPIKVEIKQLEAETAFLNTINVPAGTYSSIAITFANPELTILNNSGATIGTCANGAICELKPAISPVQVTYSGPPFPLTIVANTPIGLLVDVNLNSVIQNDLSINLAAASGVTVLQLPPIAPTGRLEDFEVFGRVTAKDAANNQFTLQTTLSGLSLIIKVDSNTQFEDFDEVGLANNFSSVAVGQFLEVEVRLMAGGMFIAEEVEFEDNDLEEDLEGVVVAISPTQFQMVLIDEDIDVAGIEVGNLMQVNLFLGTSFRIDDDDLPVSGLIFSSASDLLVGQTVEVERRSGPSGSPPTISTDRVTLKKGSFTARVKQKLSTTDFIVDNLPALFTSAGITQIQVRTSSETDFDNVSGVAALNVGDTVSLRGLLFKTFGDPVLVAKKVRKR